MAPATYEPQAPNTPFIRPIMPGPIVVPNTNGSSMIGIQISENRRLHDHELSEFHNCNLLERQIINLLLHVYKPKWLNQIQYSTTGGGNKKFIHIFSTLYAQYCQIAPHKLIVKRDEATTFRYNATYLKTEVSMTTNCPSSTTATYLSAS